MIVDSDEIPYSTYMICLPFDYSMAIRWNDSIVSLPVIHNVSYLNLKEAGLV